METWAWYHWKLRIVRPHLLGMEDSTFWAAVWTNPNWAVMTLSSWEWPGGWGFEFWHVTVALSRFISFVVLEGWGVLHFAEVLWLLPWVLCVTAGRGFDNLTSVHLARHTPTGTLVTIKITNLETCTDERLRALQVMIQGKEMLAVVSVWEDCVPCKTFSVPTDSSVKESKFN